MNTNLTTQGKPANFLKLFDSHQSDSDEDLLECDTDCTPPTLTKSNAMVLTLLDIADQN